MLVKVAPVISLNSCLSNLSPLDKMAAISQTIFSDEIFVNEKICILIKISLKFVPKSQIDNNQALV